MPRPLSAAEAASVARRSPAATRRGEEIGCGGGRVDGPRGKEESGRRGPSAAAVCPGDAFCGVVPQGDTAAAAGGGGGVPACTQRGLVAPWSAASQPGQLL